MQSGKWMAQRSEIGGAAVSIPGLPPNRGRTQTYGAFHGPACQNKAAAAGSDSVKSAVVAIEQYQQARLYAEYVSEYLCRMVARIYFIIHARDIAVLVD